MKIKQIQIQHKKKGMKKTNEKTNQTLETTWRRDNLHYTREPETNKLYSTTIFLRNPQKTQGGMT